MKKILASIVLCATIALGVIASWPRPVYAQLRANTTYGVVTIRSFIGNLITMNGVQTIGISGTTVQVAPGGNSIQLIGPIREVGGVATVGATGVPAIVAQSRSTAQTGAVASVATFTPTADGTFEVQANVLVTTATTHNFTVTCTYTDEGGTSRTVTMPFVLVAGSAIVNSVVNTNNAVPYHGIPVQIRDKGTNAITIATTGTFTTVTYNVEGVIKQIG